MIHHEPQAVPFFGSRARRRSGRRDGSESPVPHPGPESKILTLGMTTWETMLDSYAEQMRGLLAGGADVLLIETMQDMLASKCAIAAANLAMDEARRRVPIMVQASFDQNNGQQMLTGTDPSALVATFMPYDEVDVLGLNCAFGPYDLAESTRYIAEHWPRFVSVLPNAGLPVMVEGKSHFPMGPADFTKGMMRFVDDFGVNIVGGCCGTMPEHLKMLIDALGGRPPKARHVEQRPQVSSLISAEDIRQDNSYLIVAERTNTNGSKKFRTLLQSDDLDGLVS